ncbi:helix-turn-helix domain-containing protein (plasmid) [Streptomyces sp. GDS52]|uniref:helix-turn-helix domain-containing protein n=1 Tax=Streptomyces sp. GDS52 TaxID=3406419 RepID=UPI003FD4F981
MSVEHMAMVFAAEGLAGPEKLLLLAYTNYTDPNGYCWPSEQRLADDCGTSVSTVARQKRSLKEKKLLASVRRINPRTGEPISNLSRVNLPLLASMRRRDRSYDDNLMQQITFDEAPDAPEGTGSDQLNCHSDSYPLSDRQVPPVKVTGTPCQSDSQSLSDPPREPVEILLDGRSPATSGSRRSSSSGSAASGNSKPPSLTPTQRQHVTAFFQALPKELADLVPTNPPGNLKAAVLEALAVDRPQERTAGQLVEYRLLPKWHGHYASRDTAGLIEKPVGALITMLRWDRECQDDRCDERTNVDTGQPCISCEQRGVDRRAERQAEKAPERPQQPQERPVKSPTARTYTAPAYVPEQATVTPGLPTDIVAEARAAVLANRGKNRVSRIP